MQESTRILMHKNIQVADILFADAHPVEAVKIYNQDHLPPGVMNINTFVKWLEERNVSADRPFAAELFSAYNISSGADIPGISHNVSVTDCYWFASREEIQDGLLWNGVNPREKEWNTSGEALFAGRTDLVSDLEGPDFATGGYFPKCWIKEPDNIFLLKRDNTDGINTFAEIISSEIADMLNISHVPYFYSVTQGEICSGCPCIITSDEEELVPMSQMVSSRDELKNYFSSIGFADEYARLLILDFITGNAGRSLTDIAIIRNPEDLTLYGMAPVYDNGNALNEISDDDMRFMMAEAKERIRASEKIQLDIEQIENVMTELGNELSIENDTLTQMIQEIEKRGTIYNQLTKAF